MESRCTLTVCVTVSISTPAHSQINPLRSVTLLIIPLKLSIIFSVLGRRVGIQIISGTTRGTLLERAPTVNTSQRRLCNSSQWISFASHNNQFLLWVQSGLAPLINHRSDLALIIKYQFYLFLCFGSTSTLSCHVASLGYRSRSRRYTTVLEVVTSHT